MAGVLGNDLFGDLPPPTQTSATPPTQQQQLPPEPNHLNQNKRRTSASLKFADAKDSPDPPVSAAPPLKSALKSALKRPKTPSEPQSESDSVVLQDGKPEKRLKFKTTTDASETQVIEAMQKIASHIKNLSKMSRASKLAIQLIQAKSVKPETSSHFFMILQAAMSSPTSCHQASVRADYHALFTAAQDVAECLNKQQKNQLAVWTIRAVVANDLFTDDSFVFSKAAGRLKELISNLPLATMEDDVEEAAALKDETEMAVGGGEKNDDSSVTSKEESDPFGLDVLLDGSKKDEITKSSKITVDSSRKEEDEETKRFLKLQREALINCLEIAANRYRLPWCQTVIDILAKHAFDNISRFTAHQRDAIEKLWASIREQQIHRKQGKSVSGKLDVNAFEWLQQRYASEKISIRHAVGGSGDRRCTQWLG